MGSMSKSYPNRQTILIAVICILIVGGTLIYIRPELFSKKSTWKNLEISSVTNNSNVSTFGEANDSSWQKAFISVGSSSSATANKNTPLTLTDQLSRDFFARYIELKQGNLSTDQKSVDTAMSQTIQSAVNSASKPKYYTISNLLISDNYNNESIRTYGNNIGTIFMKDGPRADPTTIANDALEKDDMTILKNLEPIILSYNKMLKATIATSVPRPLANSHLSLVNSLSSILFVSQELQKLSTDPVQSMLALDLFPSSKENLRLSLLSINNFFNNNKVYYKNNEPGILFSTVPQ